VPAERRAEPPLIARARRVGWWLLAASLALLGAARLSSGKVGTLFQGTALACGLLGLLAIVNVALVRGLYRQIGAVDGDGQKGDPDEG
jgi:hypothetical protein